MAETSMLPSQDASLSAAVPEEVRPDAWLTSKRFALMLYPLSKSADLVHGVGTGLSFYCHLIVLEFQLCGSGLFALINYTEIKTQPSITSDEINKIEGNLTD